MPSWQEIFASTYGAYRLARLDAGGMHWFNHSITGFWRSFSVALLVLPPYLLILALRLDDKVESGSWYFFIEMLGYALGWVAFPLIMLGISVIFSFQRNYISYIIAYNWTAMIQVAVVLPIVLLNSGGVVGQELGLFLGVAITLAILFYQWFVALTALQTSGLTAAALVALDFVLGRLISTGADRLIFTAQG
ncbi:MAG TPA: hypothetical protein QF861_00345 [Alphaproteobacteria bacterium]|jgi:hypothetical protein|nr:hypothetical protein [Alphaproteobacteria bacterium]